MTVPDPGMFRQVVVLLVEGVGVGALADAAEYRNRGADTLEHVATYAGGFDLPLLQWMGLGNLGRCRGVDAAEPPAASFGRLSRGSQGTDAQTGLREMFSTTLNTLVEGGLDVVALGRCGEMLGEGEATLRQPTQTPQETLERIVEALTIPVTGVVLATVTPGDGENVGAYGPVNLARTLKSVDQHLGPVLDVMSTEALLLISSLGGCDMTLRGRGEPTREYAPLLAYAPAVPSGIQLGTRSSYMDVAATLAQNFGIPGFEGGESFYGPLLS